MLGHARSAIRSVRGECVWASSRHFGAAPAEPSTDAPPLPPHLQLGTGSPGDGAGGDASAPKPMVAKGPGGGGGVDRQHFLSSLFPPPPLKALIDAGLLEPGMSCLTVKYRGVSIFADLLPDGTIRFQGKVHHAPSGFSLAAKRGVNPAVFSDDGWGNVRYIPPLGDGCARRR